MQFLSTETDVKRNRYRTQFHQRHEGLQHFVTVEENRRHVVSLLDPMFGKDNGSPVGIPVPLRMGPAALFRYNGFTVRVLESRSLQEMGYGHFGHLFAPSFIFLGFRLYVQQCPFKRRRY